MSLIAESLKKASEEWDPNRYQAVDHILKRPLPLQYSNFRSHRIWRNLAFGGGLLVATVLLGFLVLGKSFEDGSVPGQAPPLSPVLPGKITAIAKSPTAEKATGFTVEPGSPEHIRPAEENPEEVHEESTVVATRMPMEEYILKRDNTVAVKSKPVIESQKTVQEKSLAVADEAPVQTETAQVSPRPVTPLLQDESPVNPRASLARVHVKAQARAPVPEKKGSLAEKDLFHDSEYYFNLAVYYQQEKNYLKALELYNEALQLNPAHARTYNNRSLIYQELGNKDKAIEGFLKSIRLDPGYGKPYNNMGLVYYQEGNYSSAVANFEKAISLSENNLESYNNLAIVYKKTNRLQDAKALYQKILTRAPSHAEASYNLAILLEDEGNIDAAVKYYQRFVKMGANSHPSLVAKVRNHLQSLE